jgi:hypothetical protein
MRDGCVLFHASCLCRRTSKFRDSRCPLGKPRTFHVANVLRISVRFCDDICGASSMHGSRPTTRTSPCSGPHRRAAEGGQPGRALGRMAGVIVRRLLGDSVPSGDGDAMPGVQQAGEAREEREMGRKQQRDEEARDQQPGQVGHDRARRLAGKQTQRTGGG